MLTADILPEKVDRGLSECDGIYSVVKVLCCSGIYIWDYIRWIIVCNNMKGIMNI